jgi:hypothetical protein
MKENTWIEILSSMWLHFRSSKFNKKTMHIYINTAMISPNSIILRFLGEKFIAPADGSTRKRDVIILFSFWFIFQRRQSEKS